MSTENFQNWQLSVASEYLSMYIKTWFAFLATAKKLHPSSISQSGDGSLIKAYKDGLAVPQNYTDDIHPHIQRLFSISQIVIRGSLPDSYLGYFYKVNNNFSVRISSNPKHDVSIEYRDKLNGKKSPNLFINYKSTADKFNKVLGQHSVECNLSLQKLIESDSFEVHDKGFDLLYDTMLDAGESLINVMPRIRNQEERIGYLRGQLATIMQLVRQETNFHDLFQPQPFHGFESSGLEESLGGKDVTTLKWFIDFNYHLRNILFHHVLDPFDPQWLELFKHAYLALQELVSFNVQRLGVHNAQ